MRSMPASRSRSIVIGFTQQGFSFCRWVISGIVHALKSGYRCAIADRVWSSDNDLLPRPRNHDRTPNLWVVCFFLVLATHNRTITT